MNKAEFIESIVNHTQLTKADATRAVEGMMAAITEVISKGDNLALVGFGTFGMRTRAARTGKNPATGAVLQIPESNVPYFKPGAKLKEAAKLAKPMSKANKKSDQ